MDLMTPYELKNSRETTAPMVQYIIEKPLVSSSVLVDLMGVLATCVLGVLTYNLTKKVAQRQFDLDDNKMKDERRHARVELVDTHGLTPVALAKEVCIYLEGCMPSNSL
jgi:hypothetical protein